MRVRATVMVVVALLAMPVVAVAQSEWYDDPVNPVVPPPNPGDWDGQRYTAAVLEVDGTYHMYYLGRLATSWVEDFQGGHATSPDGHPPWDIDPDNPVLRRGDPGEWDDFGAASGAVIHDASGFRWWYGGADGEVARVGYATSKDGSVWHKYPGNPIIDVGPPGSFDDTFVIPCTVIVRDDGVYEMWYIAARTVSPGVYDWRIGYAWSEDGLSWTKHPEPVLGPRPLHDRLYVINFNVVFDGTSYHMWYTTDEDTPGILNIAYAVSPDGIEWTRYPWNPVVGGRSGQPVVLRDQDSGEYTMWYTDHPVFSFRRATSECCPGVFYDGFDFGDTAGWTVTLP